MRSITSVVAPDGSTVPSTEYEIDDANLGFLMRITGWPYTGRLRPGLLWSDPDMGTERKSWVITYAGGWVTPAQALELQAGRAPTETSRTTSKRLFCRRAWACTAAAASIR